jgi:hypothetical protein
VHVRACILISLTTWPNPYLMKSSGSKSSVNSSSDSTKALRKRRSKSVNESSPAAYTIAAYSGIEATHNMNNNMSSVRKVFMRVVRSGRPENVVPYMVPNIVIAT